MIASKTLTSSAMRRSTKLMCSLKFQVASQCTLKGQSIDSGMSKLFAGDVIFWIYIMHEKSFKFFPIISEYELFVQVSLARCYFFNNMTKQKNQSDYNQIKRAGWQPER